jgi:arylsulfatase A-like enzyme
MSKRHPPAKNSEGARFPEFNATASPEAHQTCQTAFVRRNLETMVAMITPRKAGQSGSVPAFRLRGFAVALLLGAFSTATAGADSSPPPPPNILFAIADDWGYGHAGAYGCKWVKTPAFDRVADQGILFSHAYTPNAKCAPSRACILTGRNSWQLKAAANHVPYFPPEFKTFAEALGEHDWFVGHTTKGWSPGVATNIAGKPRQMTGRAFNARTATPPAAGIGSGDYAANFADFLSAAPKGRPWCFWYGAIEPHRGYEYGSGVAKGGKRTTDVERVPGIWPDNETVRNDMLDYAFEVEHFDRHLGRMLAELEKRSLLDNTLVIVTSDHGMPFPRVKGQAYESSNRVPLAMMWKSGLRKPGRRVDDVVSFIDLAPTFIDLAGLKWEQTGMAAATGRSLTDILFSEKSGIVNPARDHALIGKERHDVGRPHDWGYPIRGIIQGDLLYIRNYETDRWPAGNPETGYLNCDAGATKTFILDARRKNPADTYWALCFGKRPPEEVYDLKHDPDCVKNLATDPLFAEAKQRLERQMVSELKAQDDPRMFGRGEVFEQYPYANPGQRGFYERFMKGQKMEAGWVNDSDFEPRPLD